MTLTRYTRVCFFSVAYLHIQRVNVVLCILHLSMETNFVFQNRWFRYISLTVGCTFDLLMLTVIDYWGRIRATFYLFFVFTIQEKVFYNR